MGLTIDAKQKRIYTQRARKLIKSSQKKTSAAFFTSDINAMLRKRSAYNPHHSEFKHTPLSFMKQFFVSMLLNYPNVEVYTFCFDSPDTVLEARTTFHAQKRYKKATRAPKPGETLHTDGRLYKNDDVPFGDDMLHYITPAKIPEGSSATSMWSRIWSNPKLKYKMWDVLTTCLIYCIKEYQKDPKEFLSKNNNTKSNSNDPPLKPKTSVLDMLKASAPAPALDPDPDLAPYPAPSKVFIIDCVDMTQLYFPETEANKKKYGPKYQYGEADMKCNNWAEFLGSLTPERPCFFYTNDWDALVSTLVHAVPGVKVQLGNIFKVGETEYHTKKGATAACARDPTGPKQPVIYDEILDCSLYPAAFGPRRQRLHALFWILTVNGIDYCNGLVSFTFPEKFLLHVLCERKYEAYTFLTEAYTPEDPAKRVLIFDPKQFIFALFDMFSQYEGYKHKKGHPRLIADFEEELHNILLCVMYYIGFDPLRKRAGPIVSTQETHPIFTPYESAKTVADLDLYTTETCDHKVVFVEEYPATPEMLAYNIPLTQAMYPEKHVEYMQSAGFF